MNNLNLLPWRTQRHQKNLRYLCFRVVVLALLLGFAYSVLWQQQTQSQNSLNALQEQWQQLNQKQAEITSKIEQQRRQLVAPENIAMLSAAELMRRFQLLSELPLKGELAQVQINGQMFEMRGFVDNQQDFSALHQFLKSHCGEVNLLKLNDESQGIEFALQTPCKESK